MREIKFRGKRVDNGEWVYGYYVQNLTEYVWTGYQNGVRVFKQVDIPHCIVDPYNDYQNSLSYRVIPETVGQYTGINDKNGVEIYEGDIVQAEKDVFETYSRGDIENGTLEVWDELVCTIDPFGEIRFEDSAFMIEEYFLEILKECECEVIGNIHENPELLEVANAD